MSRPLELTQSLHKQPPLLAASAEAAHAGEVATAAVTLVSAHPRSLAAVVLACLVMTAQLDPTVTLATIVGLIALAMFHEKSLASQELQIRVLQLEAEKQRLEHERTLAAQHNGADTNATTHIASMAQPASICEADATAAAHTEVEEATVPARVNKEAAAAATEELAADEVAAAAATEAAVTAAKEAAAVQCKLAELTIGQLDRLVQVPEAASVGLPSAAIEDWSEISSCLRQVAEEMASSMSSEQMSAEAQTSSDAMTTLDELSFRTNSSIVRFADFPPANNAIKAPGHRRTRSEPPPRMLFDLGNRLNMSLLAQPIDSSPSTSPPGPAPAPAPPVKAMEPQVALPPPPPMPSSANGTVADGNHVGVSSSLSATAPTFTPGTVYATHEHPMESVVYDHPLADPNLSKTRRRRELRKLAKTKMQAKVEAATAILYMHQGPVGYPVMPSPPPTNMWPTPMMSAC